MWYNKKYIWSLSLVPGTELLIKLLGISWVIWMYFAPFDHTWIHAERGLRMGPLDHLGMGLVSRKTRRLEGWDFQSWPLRKLNSIKTEKSVPCLSLSFWSHQQSLSFLDLWLHNSSLFLHCHRVFSPVSMLPCGALLSYTDTSHIGLRAHTTPVYPCHN